jgi:DNA repair protein RadC
MRWRKAVETSQPGKCSGCLPQNRQIAITTIASGDPTPSRADIHIINSIVQIATPLGISGHDHIIVGKNGHASLKGMKLI